MIRTVAKTRNGQRAAFTLMEMLVVVAILVVLAGTGGVIYMRYLEDAKKDQARIQVRMLTQVCETYQVKYGDFPPSLAVLTQPGEDGSRPYLEPSALFDPWQREYQYVVPGQHHQLTGKPDIWSLGPRVGDPTGVVGNWSGQ
jgi:general secretion pathway protein G